MKPEQLEKWKEARKKGLLKYVLVSGVLAYGLPMFITMTLFLRRNELSPRSVALGAVVWAVGGAVFGLTMWWYHERQLRKAGLTRIS